MVIRLRNVSMILDGMSQDDQKELRQLLSFVVPGFKFTPKYKSDKYLYDHGELPVGEVPWDGTKTLLRYVDRKWVAPVGLNSYVREYCKSKGITCQVVDERIPVVSVPGWSTEGLVPRDYQEEIIQTCLRRERGVMQMATGSGKTETLIEVAVRSSCFPMVYYVTSCDLLEQAYDRFKGYVRYNGQPVEIGRVGGGHYDVRPITIATVQSAQLALEGTFTKFDDETKTEKVKLTEENRKLIVEMAKEAQFVFVDECHHVSCNTIQAILNNSFKARMRFGGSASPWRDDGLDILIEACFGRRLCSVDASFLIEQGYLVRPWIMFNHFKSNFGTTENFNAHYTKYVVENQVRNEWIAKRAKFHVDKGRTTIILVKWTRHAEMLAELIPGAEILTSTGSSKKTPIKRKAVLDRLRSKSLMCVIGTSLLDEGVDVPSAEVGIFAGTGKSSTRALQRVGRFIRKDKNNAAKEVALIEEFHDHTMYLADHAKARRAILETEKEFKIRDNKATLNPYYLEGGDITFDAFS